MGLPGGQHRISPRFQLIVLGVIGEYIGKIYREVGQRPAYLIAKSHLTLPSAAKQEGPEQPYQTEWRNAMTETKKALLALPAEEPKRIRGDETSPVKKVFF